MRALLVSVGSELYALPMAAALQVVPDPIVTQLPTAPPSVRGVFTLRGELIPLLDTAVLLGLPGSVAPPGAVVEGAGPTTAVVVSTLAGPAGLAVSGMPAWAELDEPTGPADGPGAVATHLVEGRAAVLVDIATLVTRERVGG